MQNTAAGAKMLLLEIYKQKDFRPGREYEEKEIRNMARSIIISQEENWFVAMDVDSGVTSQGKTKDRAIRNLEEALELYFEGTADCNDKDS